ncbi:hypothetical protein D9M68_426070 [compost metagenome]
MDIDEARHDHPVAARTLTVERTFVVTAHMDEALVVIGDVGVVQIDVAIALAVEGDERVHIADDMNLFSHAMS